MAKTAPQAEIFVDCMVLKSSFLLQKSIERQSGMLKFSPAAQESKFQQNCQDVARPSVFEIFEVSGALLCKVQSRVCAP